MNITINGYNIDYNITGEGDKTVVILQGWGTKHEIYNQIAACINTKYRVVQFDFRDLEIVTSQEKHGQYPIMQYFL